jgi:hypothetical protein
LNLPHDIGGALVCTVNDVTLLGLADDSNRFIALLLEKMRYCRWSTSRRSLDWTTVAFGPRTAPWSPASRTHTTCYFQSYSPELLNRVGLELVAGHHLLGFDQAQCRRRRR